jgi:hypothetical protein
VHPDKVTAVNTPAPPSRADVEAHLLGLIEGRISRDDATAWAMQWVAASDPGVDDAIIWEALNNLAGADAVSTDRPYLFAEVDFRAWLDELRQG